MRVHADVEMVVDNDEKVAGIVTTDDMSKQLRGISVDGAVKYLILGRKNN